jgi:hypothetical protein
LDLDTVMRVAQVAGVVGTGILTWVKVGKVVRRWWKRRNLHLTSL